jgi:hypothetical protein
VACRRCRDRQCDFTACPMSEYPGCAKSVSSHDKPRQGEVTIPQAGSVLGVDIGFSSTRRSSAACRLDWTGSTLHFAWRASVHRSRSVPTRCAASLIAHSRWQRLMGRCGRIWRLSADIGWRSNFSRDGCKILALRSAGSLIYTPTRAQSQRCMVDSASNDHAIMRLRSSRRFQAPFWA